MELEAILKIADSNAKAECNRRNYRITEDLKQDVRMAVWIEMEKGKTLSRTAIRRIAKNKIVDEIRLRFGRSSKRPKLLHMSLGDWQEVEDKKSTPKVDKERLSSINADLKDIFVLSLEGLTINDISKRLKLSRSVVHRKLVVIKSLIRNGENE